MVSRSSSTRCCAWGAALSAMGLGLTGAVAMPSIDQGLQSAIAAAVISVPAATHAISVLLVLGLGMDSSGGNSGADWESSCVSGRGADGCAATGVPINGRGGSV